MNKQLMKIVLPRLARRLHCQLERYRSGELDQTEFSQRFESLLQKQYSWLSEQGVPEAEAAVAIHAGVLILSSPGLRAEAEQLGVPLEVVEFKAVQMAAADVAKNYRLSPQKALRQIAAIVAHYAE
jgi:hypothetical protein